MGMFGINVLDFGVDNTGAKDSTLGFKNAIDACAAAGGGTIFVPAGEYLSGAIILKSNMNFHIDAGATIHFVNDVEKYPVVNSRWEGVQREVYASCIYAENETNVTVSGLGTLDGKGAFWWNLHRQKKNLYPRPKLISFHECNHVTIQGITLTNSPSWTINPICCENVLVDGITILNPADSPNTDGVNPESCLNVRIANCHIDVGDDCIAIKAGTEDTMPRVSCENITITNCTMVHGHGGVVLGSEMSGDIRNVTISNCVFDGTDRGIRLKSRRGRGGVVEDIRVSNIVMRNVICPFIMKLYYFCGPMGKEKYVWDKSPYPITKETPTFRRIHCSNITARGVNAAAGFIYGLSELYIEDVSFTNIHIAMAEDAVPGIPAMMDGVEPMAKKGFFVSNAKNVLFENISFEGHEGPAFELENVIDVKIKDCKAYGQEFTVNGKNITTKNE